MILLLSCQRQDPQAVGDLLRQELHPPELVALRAEPAPIIEIT